MLRDFNAFYSDIKCGCVFRSWGLPPPIYHLDCFRLSLRTRRNAEELQANFAVYIQHAICTNKLKDGGDIWY